MVISLSVNLQKSSSSRIYTSGQEDFLSLMVEQVKNNRDTNGDSREQIKFLSSNNNINIKHPISQLASSLQSHQALQASALVGRKVLVHNNVFNLGFEGTVTATIDIVPGVSNVKVLIYSSWGELLRTIDLEPLVTGHFNFIWDGANNSHEKMVMGKYTIQVSGLYKGQTVFMPILTYGNVDSVFLGQNGEGLQLNVAGIGTVSLNDVKQISL